MLDDWSKNIGNADNDTAAAGLTMKTCIQSHMGKRHIIGNPGAMMTRSVILDIKTPCDTIPGIKSSHPLPWFLPISTSLSNAYTQEILKQMSFNDVSMLPMMIHKTFG